MIPEEQLQAIWFPLEKLHDYPPPALEPPLLAMAREMSDWGMENVKYSLNEYNQGLTTMYYLVDERRQAAEQCLQVILAGPEQLDEIHGDSNETAARLKLVAEEILAADLTICSDKELGDKYQRLWKEQTHLHLIRGIAWLLETQYELFSNYLVSFLHGHLQKKGLADDPVLVFATLTNPVTPTLATEERQDLLRLAQRVKIGEIANREDEPAILDQAKKYSFINFGAAGPVLTSADVCQQIADLLTHVQDLTKELSQVLPAFTKNAQEQETLLTRLSIDEKHQHLLRLARDIVWQKAWSKEHQFLGWQALDKLLRELGRRHFLSSQQTRYLLPQEILNFCEGIEVDPEELNQRYLYSFLIIEPAGSYFVTGQAARDLKAKMRFSAEETQTIVDGILIGRVAVAGQAKGRVKIVNTVKEMDKMETGDILVSEMTIPEIVPAMKKAAAIVTDMGGITCHAAIVSRELHKPCVIGTKIATQVLKDGDWVEVDAAKGEVRLIPSV